MIGTAPAYDEELVRRRGRLSREAFLRRVREDLHGLFPGRIDRLVLYGSRARGDARDDGTVDDSDWDVAVFMNGEVSRDDRDAVHDWSTDLLLESGWDVSPMLMTEQAWGARTIFMYALRRDAVIL